MEIVPLSSCSEDAIAGAIKGFGVSRFMVEKPYSGDTPGRFLLTRTLADAERDDAVALGVLKHGALAGLLVLRFPEWDREHFGFVVGRIEHLHGADDLVLGSLVQRAMEELLRRRTTMCSARLSNDSLCALHLLEGQGFRFQELTLSPWRDLASWERKGYDVTRPTEAEDMPSMMRIARRAFSTDRFHLDPHFSREAADSVYEKWVSSWHESPDPSRHSRVLEVEGRVAGFCMFERLFPLGDQGDAAANLVLVCVDPDRAGQGYGYRMYSDFLDTAASMAKFASVVMVSSNIAAVNLCMKLGFRFGSSGDVTLHWWPGNTKGD